MELKLWVRTRWASLHAALEWIVKLEKVCSSVLVSSLYLTLDISGNQSFVQTADDDDKVPNLAKKCYLDYRLTRVDWEQLKVVHEVLSVGR
jgi:hypothetical protein